MPSVIQNDQQEEIESTGCGELNDQLLMCHDQHRDWRKCRAETQAFRDCYERYQRGRVQNLNLQRTNSSSPITNDQVRPLKEHF